MESSRWAFGDAAARVPAAFSRRDEAGGDGGSDRHDEWRGAGASASGGDEGPAGFKRIVMSSHLSEEQIAACVAGERSGEAQAHLAECAACAAEAERTTGALALFRLSGAQCAEYWAGRPARRASRAWRWAIAVPVM